MRLQRGDTALPTAEHSQPDETRLDWRTIVIASVGGGLEFYDFIVYGIFAPYIARTFFPTGSAATSIVAAFAAFAVGYVARPLGGLVLSHIGDRFGRRGAFSLSLITMTVTTVAMALMPGYASLGVTASASFIALRFIQGACIGGELPGAIAYVVETAPKRTGLACGLMFSCVNTGSLIAAGVSIGLHSVFSEPGMMSTGWRLGFLIGGVLGAIGALMRRSLRETALFLAVGEKKRARIPAWEVMRGYLPQILLGVGIVGLNQTLIAILNVAMVPYLTQVAGYSARLASTLVMTAIGFMSVMIVVVGYASDFFRRTSINLAGCAIIAAGGYPFYVSLVSTSINPYLVFCAAAAACSLIAGTFGAIASDLFPTRLRFSGLAISYNVAAALLGGFTPLVTTVIAGNVGNKAAPGILVSIVAVWGLLSVLAMRFSKPVYAGDPCSIQS